VELKKAITAATRPEMTAYNGNIDQFERGMSQDRLTEVCMHTIIQYIHYNALYSVV
jgi:hypothetical protein